MASDPAGGPFFGYSVSLYDDMLAIGANPPLSSGSAYLFTRDGPTWKQLEYLEGLYADSLDDFGCSVSLYNRVLAVGSSGEPYNGTIDYKTDGLPGAGSVYVYW